MTCCSVGQFPMQVQSITLLEPKFSLLNLLSVFCTALGNCLRTHTHTLCQAKASLFSKFPQHLGICIIKHLPSLRSSLLLSSLQVECNLPHSFPRAFHTCHNWVKCVRITANPKPATWLCFCLTKLRPVGGEFYILFRAAVAANCKSKGPNWEQAWNA